MVATAGRAGCQDLGVEAGAGEGRAAVDRARRGAAPKFTGRLRHFRARWASTVCSGALSWCPVLLFSPYLLEFLVFVPDSEEVSPFPFYISAHLHSISPDLDFSGISFLDFFSPLLDSSSSVFDPWNKYFVFYWTP